jgi:hypothetical protein
MCQFHCHLEQGDRSCASNRQGSSKLQGSSSSGNGSPVIRGSSGGSSSRVMHNSSSSSRVSQAAQGVAALIC